MKISDLNLPMIAVALVGTTAVLAADAQATTSIASSSFGLELSSGTEVVTIIDGSLSDASAVNGQIIFTGSIGSIDTAITVGVSNAPGDEIQGATLSLTSLTIQNTGSGPADLTIRLTDIGFSSPNVSSVGELISDLSITQISSPLIEAAFISSADVNNNPFGASTSAPTLLLSDNGGVESSTSFISPGDFSLTSELSISFDGAGTITATGNTVVVPEPASLGILAAGSLLMVTRRRRR